MSVDVNPRCKRDPLRLGQGSQCGGCREPPRLPGRPPFRRFPSPATVCASTRHWPGLRRSLLLSRQPVALRSVRSNIPGQHLASRPQPRMGCTRHALITHVLAYSLLHLTLWSGSLRSSSAGLVDNFHPLMANRLAQTGSSSSGLAVQPVFGRKQLPWSARLADHFCCAQQAQCTLLSGPMGPVQMTSVPRRVAVLGPCVWTALTKMYLNHTGPRGSAVRLNSELQSGWLAVETV